MAFVPDRRFENLTEALEFILNRYALRLSDRLWLETGSGLLIQDEVPQYLFRGECGDFETTKASTHRPGTYTLRDGAQLSALDLQTLQVLIRDLARRFTKEDYSLDKRQAIGLLQHYGLPTFMVDFTGHLGYAFAFAAAGTSGVGRVAVVPTCALSATGRLVDLSNHSWTERPRRQAAYGVITTKELHDLKSEAARSQLNVSWYEFPVSDSDRSCLKGKSEKLVSLADDPSAGFLRFHITEYVEVRGKFSPELTAWLIERVPIAPRCYRVRGFEAKDVVVNHCEAEVLPAFDEAAEAEHSRRYWSSAHHECSRDRMKDWVWPPPQDSIVADPRTYHPSL
jgi:hypothetical protein